ncbi:hypothetical protein [Paenibacillus gallinarum]|uniref:Bypass of forespore C C-terminal domain-containing protein n=1 Tax=Paenibacillus gallinarum TaxID=2762232 RepID=A0ABR8T1M9_9BACL|nr:hypothetical protein [Paenibacillus gallinarum]MBD7969597.1 hypothetical protein [Paenibacillus gallinarum]
MQKTTQSKTKKFSIILLSILVLLTCYIIFNQVHSIASVTLKSVNEDSLIVSRGDRDLKIKSPEIITTLLEEGREYIVTYNTYPIIGSFLKSIELSP